jgi:hypothetical protein
MSVPSRVITDTTRPPPCHAIPSTGVLGLLNVPETWPDVSTIRTDPSVLAKATSRPSGL